MMSFFIDTATSISNIALLKDGKLIDKITIETHNGLSNIIFKHIDNLFEKNNVTPDDIKIIYVVVGPGSFTGIRIGVTIAKTFAWAKRLRIIPLSSLEVMASASDEQTIVPIIDARRGYVFAGVYDNGLNIIMEDQYISLDELAKKHHGFYINNSLNIDVEKVVIKHQFDNGLNPHLINPQYLKITEAEENCERM